MCASVAAEEEEEEEMSGRSAVPGLLLKYLSDVLTESEEREREQRRVCLHVCEKCDKLSQPHSGSLTDRNRDRHSCM